MFILIITGFYTEAVLKEDLMLLILQKYQKKFAIL